MFENAIAEYAALHTYQRVMNAIAEYGVLHTLSQTRALDTMRHDTHVPEIAGGTGLDQHVKVCMSHATLYEDAL